MSPKISKPTTGRSPIAKLNDDCLWLIFGMLNLNDRASLRATCKRFQRLSDHIKIRKLIIFERKPPLAGGRLECSGEVYRPEHTAYVTRMDALFANQLVVNQMSKFLKTLAIFGCDRSRLTLEHTFPKLEHLELHDIDVRNWHLLRSPSIRTFASNYAFFRKPCEVEKYLNVLKELRPSHEHANLPPSALVYAFDQMQSRNIRRLMINRELEDEFFKYGVEQGLFASIERLDVVLNELSILPYLSEKCPRLRRIDCLIFDLDAFLKSVTKHKLKKIMGQIRDDLRVNLHGFPLNSKAPQLNKFLIKFFESFRDVIRVNASRRMCLHLDQLNVDVLKGISEYCDLGDFFALVGGIHLNEQTIIANDAEFFRANFANCVEVKFESIQNPIPSPKAFHDFLTVFPGAKEMLVRADGFDVELDNSTLDNLGVCDQVEVLYLEIWGRMNNLNVLFKLSKLQNLRIFSYLPIKQTVIVELIEALRYLQYFQVVFVKPPGLSKESLKQFKDRVNSQFKKRFEIAELEFRVEVRKRDSRQIVRYLLIDQRKCGTFCHNEDNKMFDLIEFKRSRL